MDGPTVGELVPPERTLMGPGPSEVHPRVLRAMTTPLVGHLDPAFVELMDEVQELLRYAFQTDNTWTIPVSGTGSAAMEAVVSNLVEPGETVLVPDNGYFGERMAAMARRAGGEVATVEADWGRPLEEEAVAGALERHQPDIMGLVHAETSTGALQPDVPALVERAHDHDALVILDAVTSLGGIELRVDAWEVDAVYSAGQKCLSSPPGASPVTLSADAMRKVVERETPVRSWYLDLSLLSEYWGEERAYHHTAPITNVYALREALRIVAEEGLEARWDRHERVAGALRTGLEATGLEPVASEDWWVPSLTTVRVPSIVDPADVVEAALAAGVEVAGGLGDLAGEVIRVGCMGYSARPATVLETVATLGEAIEGAGGEADVAAGLAATERAL